MTEKKTAYEVIKETYSIETLREIEEYGCSSGIADKHKWPDETERN